MSTITETKTTTKVEETKVEEKNDNNQKKQKTKSKRPAGKSLERLKQKIQERKEQQKLNEQLKEELRKDEKEFQAKQEEIYGNQRIDIKGDLIDDDLPLRDTRDLFVRYEDEEECFIVDHNAQSVEELHAKILEHENSVEYESIQSMRSQRAKGLVETGAQVRALKNCDILYVKGKKKEE
mmetsp:Transcript_7648/g.11358  ORF Transcript_7648/g.11358 Transcript_7648/m.11358 type:complete len:180 (-) Transcript_7648:94-633(-)